MAERGESGPDISENDLSVHVSGDNTFLTGVPDDNGQVDEEWEECLERALAREREDDRATADAETKDAFVESEDDGEGSEEDDSIDEGLVEKLGSEAYDLYAKAVGVEIGHANEGDENEARSPGRDDGPQTYPRGEERGEEDGEQEGVASEAKEWSELEHVLEEQEQRREELERFVEEMRNSGTAKLPEDFQEQVERMTMRSGRTALAREGDEAPSQASSGASEGGGPRGEVDRGLDAIRELDERIREATEDYERVKAQVYPAAHGERAKQERRRQREEKAVIRSRRQKRREMKVQRALNAASAKAMGGHAARNAKGMSSMLSDEDDRLVEAILQAEETGEEANPFEGLFPLEAGGEEAETDTEPGSKKAVDRLREIDERLSGLQGSLEPSSEVSSLLSEVETSMTSEFKRKEGDASALRDMREGRELKRLGDAVDKRLRELKTSELPEKPSSDRIKQLVEECRRSQEDPESPAVESSAHVQEEEQG